MGKGVKMGKSLRSKIKRKFRAIKRDNLVPEMDARKQRAHEKTMADAAACTLNEAVAAPVEGDQQMFDYEERCKRDEQLKAIRKKNAFKSRKPRGKSDPKVQKRKAAAYFKKNKKKK